MMTHFWVDQVPEPPLLEALEGVRYLQWLVRWKGYAETNDEWLFDDDVKEDLDAETYAKVRAKYEQVARIPAGSLPSSQKQEKEAGRVKPPRARQLPPPSLRVQDRPELLLAGGAESLPVYTVHIA